MGGFVHKAERFALEVIVVIVADLISWCAGLVGTFLLSIAVGPPPRGIYGGDLMTPRGQFLNAYWHPKRWWTGMGFIGVAFLFQLLKILSVPFDANSRFHIFYTIFPVTR